MLSQLLLVCLQSALVLAKGKVPEQYTPEDMLATPRPQDAIAAPDGKHALSVVSQWDPKSDKTTTTVYVIDLEGLEKLQPEIKPKDRTRKLWSCPSGQASEFVWLGNETVAYVNGSALMHFSVDEKSKHETMHILDFPKGTEPSGLQYEPETRTLIFSAAVWEDNLDLEKTGAGDEKYANRGDDGLVLDDLYVRHWDTWRIPGRIYTLATTRLNKRGNKFTGGHSFTNVLKGTGLYSQMDAIPSSQVAISPKNIALAIKSPKLSPALHTRTDVYLFDTAKGGKPQLLTPEPHGAVDAVVFSPDGKKLAWLQMAEDGYESDKLVVIVHPLGGKSERWTDEWDRSPSTLVWGVESKTLYITAQYKGRTLPYHLSHQGMLPTPLLFKGSTSSIAPLTESTFLLSISSLQHPTEIFFLDLEEGPHDDPDKLPAEQVLQLTHHSEKAIDGRLDGMYGHELWFKGVDGRNVMAWVVKPRGYSQDDKAASYPMAFLIHGGPQGAWDDSWSTRWNPAVYASAGYWVVAVNPTGSTGYGQEFTDRIKQHWGDRPFQDLVAGYYAALAKYPQIDSQRTTALGASYGGYMINWINGHNVFGFKALVYHDGILDTADMFYATEELYFPVREFGGSPATARAEYEKWNPMNHVAAWNTPELVIQGGKDFRLPEAVGLGTFTALQYHGIPSRLVYFPDENHWVLRPANSRRWHTEVLRWLDEWVGHGKTPAKNPGSGVGTPAGKQGGDSVADASNIEAALKTEYDGIEGGLEGLAAAGVDIFEAAFEKVVQAVQHI